MYFKTPIAIASSVMIGVFLVGCASIISKSDYPVAIQSSPKGIPFTITDGTGNTISSGDTPQTVTLKAGAGFFKSQHYTVSYKTTKGVITRDITAGIDGWYIANILFGGIIGLLIVDPATGAMYKLPDSVTMDMDSLSMGNGETSTSGLTKPNNRIFKLVSTNELNHTQRAQLIPISVN